MLPHHWLLVYHGSGALGAKCVAGFVEVEFMVVHMLIDAHS